MKILKILVMSLMLSNFVGALQAQDTIRKTTIISSDTTLIRKDSSNAKKAMNKPAPAPAPAAAPATAPAATPAASGQDNEEFPQVGFHLGLRFQPGFASISSDKDPNTVSVGGRVGYGYGLSLAYYYNNYIGTQLELMYSTLAQDYTDRFNTTHTVNLNYLSIPIITTFNTNYGKPVNFNVGIGPQLGLLVGSSVTNNNGNFNAVLAAKGMDVGIGYGGGLDFALGPKHKTHINIGYRGVQGLIDIDNSGSNANQSTSSYYLLQKSKTNLNSFYIGMMFKL
jgi:hypothetical protein